MILYQNLGHFNSYIFAKNEQKILVTKSPFFLLIEQFPNKLACKERSTSVKQKNYSFQQLDMRMKQRINALALILQVIVAMVTPNIKH